MKDARETPKQDDRSTSKGNQDEGRSKDPALSVFSALRIYSYIPCVIKYIPFKKV